MMIGERVLCRECRNDDDSEGGRRRGSIEAVQTVRCTAKTTNKLRVVKSAGLLCGDVDGVQNAGGEP